MAKEINTSKPEKAKKDKENIFARAAKRTARWFREMKSELKKVQWPTAKQTVNNTLIVILCVIVVGVFIWIFDALASGIIGALISLVKG